MQKFKRKVFNLRIKLMMIKFRVRAFYSIMIKIGETWGKLNSLTKKIKNQHLKGDSFSIGRLPTND
jgi:hypothetical protein